ncbi:putative phage tail protein [Paenibacillus ferrarius]|uniref:putative phage tail protein n=1 Tax=Paenibacillus ferrarius TaxID=1469647 RepID=UPI003D26B55F
MIELEIGSTAGARMLGSLPELYENIHETRALLQAEGVEIDDLNGSLSDVMDQAIVDRATWGLSYWEYFLGISTDITKPYDQRRSVIKSKIRGTGTVTVQLVKRVALSFTNGNVDVDDQPYLYQFSVQFLDALGVPPNLDDFKAAIEQIKPAHIAVVYKFRYLTIAEAEAMTIAEIESTKLDRFLGGGF